MSKNVGAMYRNILIDKRKIIQVFRIGPYYEIVLQDDYTWDFPIYLMLGPKDGIFKNI